MRGNLRYTLGPWIRSSHQIWTHRLSTNIISSAFHLLPTPNTFEKYLLTLPSYQQHIIGYLQFPSNVPIETIIHDLYHISFQGTCCGQTNYHYRKTMHSYMLTPSHQNYTITGHALTPHSDALPTSHRATLYAITATYYLIRHLIRFYHSSQLLLTEHPKRITAANYSTSNSPLRPINISITDKKIYSLFHKPYAHNLPAHFPLTLDKDIDIILELYHLSNTPPFHPGHLRSSLSKLTIRVYKKTIDTPPAQQQYEHLQYLQNEFIKYSKQHHLQHSITSHLPYSSATMKHKGIIITKSADTFLRHTLHAYDLKQYIIKKKNCPRMS